MKVQLRRFVTIGLMSGSLALSALVGGAAVGAAAPDATAVNNGVSGNRSQEVRDDVTVAPVTTDRVVVITPASVVTSSAPVQVFNDDRRN